MEVLMTTVLMGLAIVALLTTLMTLIVSSHSHRRRVRAANEAVVVVEAIESATYAPCSGTGGYGGGYDAVMDKALKIGSGSGVDDPQRHNYVITLDKVEFLVSDEASQATFQPTCPGGDKGAQRITVSVMSPDKTRVTESIEFVKRSDLNDCSTENCE